MFGVISFCVVRFLFPTPQTFIDRTIKPLQIEATKYLCSKMVLKQLYQRPNESDKDFEKRKDKQIKDAERRQRQKAAKEKLEKKREQSRIRSKNYRVNKKRKAADKQKETDEMRQEIDDLREELQVVKRKISDQDSNGQINREDMGRAIGVFTGNQIHNLGERVSALESRQQRAENSNHNLGNNQPINNPNELLALADNHQNLATATDGRMISQGAENMPRIDNLSVKNLTVGSNNLSVETLNVIHGNQTINNNTNYNTHTNYYYNAAPRANTNETKELREDLENLRSDFNKTTRISNRKQKRAEKRIRNLERNHNDLKRSAQKAFCENSDEMCGLRNEIYKVDGKLENLGKSQTEHSCQTLATATDGGRMISQSAENVPRIDHVETLNITIIDNHGGVGVQNNHYHAAPSANTNDNSVEIEELREQLGDLQTTIGALDRKQQSNHQWAKANINVLEEKQNILSTNHQEPNINDHQNSDSKPMARSGLDRPAKTDDRQLTFGPNETATYDKESEPAKSILRPSRYRTRDWQP